MDSLKRNSSIELLRILSMIMIVIYHYQARTYGLYVIDNSRLGEPNLLPEIMLHSMGKLGVPTFVFISGWFGLHFRKKRFVEIVVTCAFYAVISFAGMALLYDVNYIKHPVFFLNLWWFMAAYLCLYMISPALEHMFTNYSRRFMLLTTLIFTYISYGDCFVDSARIGGLYQMFTMYLWARCARLYFSDFLQKWWLLLLMVCLLLRFGLVVLGYYTSHLGILMYLNSYVCPLSSLIAAGLLVGFSKITFRSNIINILSAASLSVYLCSESAFGIKCFDSLFPHDVWSMKKYIGGAIFVYAIITIVDQVRRLIVHRLLINRIK